MKKTKIVVPALAVLLLSTAASVSGTVAWFSMSTRVTVTGMSVTTKVSSNLQIAAINQEANYTDSITQSREGVLEPASSINGATGTFYYTTNAKGDGDAKTDEYVLYSEAAVQSPDNSLASADASALGKTNFDKAFNDAYDFAYDKTNNNGTDKVAFGYIDYSFYLKGTSSVAGQSIVMTKCNMLYNTSPITTSYAWRVGVFAQPCDANDNNTTVTDATATAVTDSVATYQKTILDFGDGKSENQAANKAIAAASGANVMGDVYHPGANAVLATLGTNESPVQTQRYKVIVRLWLEGEDKSCTNTTYASLVEDWTLDLEFKLGKNADANDHTFDGVNVIGSVAA